MKLAFAEDNEILRKSLSFFLKQKGFEVDEFNNGKVAIEAICKIDYDLILTDINMPGMSGVEMTFEIRNKLKKETPIIIFTNSTVEQTEIDAFEVGANEFIAKPVSPDILLIRIHKLLKK